MDTIKFGLMLTIIPFTAIFLFIAIWWALVDMSIRQISGAKRVLWTILVVLLPPFGSILYNFLVKQRNLIKNYDVSLAGR